jgi:hypothetical protein
VVLRRDLAAWKIFALQLILGSDPNRERFNFQRLLHGDPANLLFRRKIK